MDIRQSGNHRTRERARIAAGVNQLFTQYRRPDGKEYSLGDVMRGTGGRLSQPWLGMLRQGEIARPGADKIQLLAAFFGVSSAFVIGMDDWEPRHSVDEQLNHGQRHA